MWDVFKDWIFYSIQFFDNLCGDWGLAIIIITIIFRICMWPIMHKQAVSSYKMQKIQPEIQRIQSKFSDDKVRMNEEMQKLYAEAKFNPLAGCVPMLLQMPIFMALYQVLSEMGKREEVASTGFSFYNLVPNLTQTPAGSFSEGFGFFIPYLILLLVFSCATFFPMIQQQLKQKDNPQRNQTLIMGVVMTIFMLWVGWSSPAGVLLFWGVSSVIGIGQSQLATTRCKQKEAQAEAEKVLEVKPIEVDVVRRVKKKRQTKKQ